MVLLQFTSKLSRRFSHQIMPQHFSHLVHSNRASQRSILLSIFFVRHHKEPIVVLPIQLFHFQQQVVSFIRSRLNFNGNLLPTTMNYNICVFCLMYLNMRAILSCIFFNHFHRKKVPQRFVSSRTKHIFFLPAPIHANMRRDNITLLHQFVNLFRCQIFLSIKPFCIIQFVLFKFGYNRTRRNLNNVRCHVRMFFRRCNYFNFRMFVCNNKNPFSNRSGQ